MSPGNRLVDKVAIVTGGASGIGESICREFAAQGAVIAIADQDAEKARGVVAELEKSGTRAQAFQVDIREASRVREVVDEVTDSLGTIDILVNCAGVSLFKPVYEFTDEEWERIRSINLDGPWNFSRAVVPVMIDKKYGKIVNIASAAGTRATPHAAPYSTAKHGVVGLTRTFAVDLGRFGINVNCICPASVDSPLLRVSVSEAYCQAMVDRLPLGRLGKGSDIAKAALFLASDDAEWITGVILPVDGGLTCCNYSRHQE